MCRCPIKVRSPKFGAGTYIAGADKEFLFVPCGHCPECNNKRVNDLVFRAYHEFLHTLSVGGFTLMQTLTYSELNVPIAGGFRFFRKSDLQKFMKRLRKRLTDDGYDINGRLKYLITSEYGEKKYRPHYHPVFFVTFDIDPNLFDSYVADAWCNLGSQYVCGGSIGRVDISSTHKRLVNSVYGIQYVCKYIFKGTQVVKALKKYGWTDISQYAHNYCFSTGTRLMWSSLEDWQLSEIWRGFVYQHPEYEDIQLLPFYLSSKGLGLTYLEDISYDELFDIVKIPSNSPLGFVPFTLPQYYIRKVFYDYDKVSKRFILNDLGRDFEKSSNQKMYDSYYDLVQFNKSLNDDLYKKLFKNLPYKSLDDAIKYLLKDAKFEHFVLYALYLKDRRISPLHYWLIPDNTYDLLKILPQFCEQIFNDNLTQHIQDSPSWIYCKDAQFFGDSSSSVERYHDRILPLYNDLPVFVNFDTLYNILAAVKQEFNIYHSKVLKQQYEVDADAKLALSSIQPYNALYY